MNNPWDEIASKRHVQLTEARDFSYSRLIEPKIISLLSKVKGLNHMDFLEVGSGTGVLAVRLSSMVKTIVGIDPSQASVQLAKQYSDKRKIHNISFQAVNISEFANTSKQKFDFCISLMALQAIPDLQTALMEIAACLKLGAGFLFCIPHPCFFSLIVDDFKKQKYRYSQPSFHEIEFPVGSDPGYISQKVPYYHRPLEHYINSITSCGFTITGLFEPFPSAQQIKKYYKKPRLYPSSLIFLGRLTET